MKKILILVLIIFVITGCSSNTEKNNKIDNKIENITTLSCYHETYLFHSKKSVEHIISINKDNKITNYKYIEKYYEFDDDNDFSMICEGAPEEAENNNKLYNYLNEVANCNKNNKEVTISDTYNISKLETKNKIPTQEIKDNLDDNFILDVDGFKDAIGNKGYTCKEI